MEDPKTEAMQAQARMDQFTAEVQVEAERLALMRQLEEKGELHTATLSTVEGLKLGAFLWFNDTEGKSVMVQVLDIDHETSQVKVRELSKGEELKVQGVNRKARRARKAKQ